MVRMQRSLQTLKQWVHPFPLPHALAIAGGVIALGLVLLIPQDGDPAMREITVAESETLATPVPLPAAESTDINAAPDADEPDPTSQVERQTVRSGDSLSKLFARQGLSAQLLLEITKSENRNAKLSDLIVGQDVIFSFAEEQLVSVRRQITPFDSVVATQQGDRWDHVIETREPEIYLETADARIDSSLFLAGARAGLPDSLIMELADIYGHMIDFVYEIRSGDQFKVTFEKRYLDGEFVEYGRILAAEFVNSGEHFLAFRFTDSEGDTGYYDERGVSLQKAFLRFDQILVGQTN